MNKDKAFIQFVKAQCKKHSIKLVLSKNNYVSTSSGCKCNGFFDDSSRVLAAACGIEKDKWIKTLVHEYGHMTQWLDKSRIYNKCVKFKSEQVLELWYDGSIEIDKKQVSYHTGIARDVEEDCEKRTVKLIREFGISMDVKEYIKHANAYLVFWTFTKEIRSWYKIGHEPYNNKALLDLVPTVFLEDYEKISKYRKALKNL